MSKRKDRLYTNYRCCPICGGKSIEVSKLKRFFRIQTVIECNNWNCNKNIIVKEIQ